MSELKSTVSEYALTNETNLEVAFETYMAFEDIKMKLCEKFLRTLEFEIKRELPEDDWRFPNTGNVESPTFLIKNKHWGDSVAFGLHDFNDQDRLCLAVRIEENIPAELGVKLSKELQGKITGFGWWRQLSGPENRWDESFEGLKKLLKPSDLVQEVAPNIVTMAKIIDGHFKAIM